MFLGSPPTASAWASLARGSCQPCSKQSFLSGQLGEDTALNTVKLGSAGSCGPRPQGLCAAAGGGRGPEEPPPAASAGPSRRKAGSQGVVVTSGNRSPFLKAAVGVLTGHGCVGGAVGNPSVWNPVPRPNLWATVGVGWSRRWGWECWWPGRNHSQ